MRFSRTAPAFPRAPKLPRLPKIPQPRLHQPTFRVTAMVATVAVVSAVAVTAPAPSGALVRGGARPAAAFTASGPVSPTSSNQPVYGAPTTTTTAVPPPNTTVAGGPGATRTVLFNNPNSNVQLASALAGDGIPVTALEAYQDGANAANAAHPGCHIPWPLLAGIGRVESDHGRYGGAVLRQDGTSTRPIIGIALNGNGTELVTDTDGGRLDGDPVYDHAVGPMQFIPSTWQIYGADGNGDGIKDPFNIFDAALAAADYLCVAGGDLSTTAGQTRAVLTYNHSSAYLAEVLGLEHTYASGDPGLIIPALPTVVPPLPTRKPGGGPVPPPADPGPPLAHKPPKQPDPSPSPSKHPTPAPSTSAADPSPSDSGTPSGTTTAPSPSDTGTPSDTTTAPSPSDTGTPSDTTSSTCSATPTDSPSTTSTGPSTAGANADPAGASTSSQSGGGTHASADASTASSTGSSTDASTGSSTGTPSGSPAC